MGSQCMVAFFPLQTQFIFLSLECYITTQKMKLQQEDASAEIKQDDELNIPDVSLIRLSATTRVNKWKCPDVHLWKTGSETL